MHYIILSFIALLISTPAHPAAMKELSPTDAQLLDAAECSHVASARQAIAGGAHVNARDLHGNTPLHIACDPELVELLLNAKADIDATNVDGKTPLHRTCNIDPRLHNTKEKIREKIGLLIQHKASIDATRKMIHWLCYGTALHNAAYHYYAATTAALLDARADPHVREYGYHSSGSSALGLALNRLSWHPELLQHDRNAHEIEQTILLLVQAGGKPPANIQNMHPEAQCILYDAQAKALTITADEQLFHAAELSRISVAQAALNNNANPNARDVKNGNTPLHIARNPALVELLLKASADVNATNSNDETPLHIICGAVLYIPQQARKNIELLLAYNASLETKAKPDGRTALFMATHKFDVPLMELLLAAKADPNAQETTANPLSPLGTSLNQAQWLLSKTIQPRWGDPEKSRPHIQKVVSLLIKAGAHTAAGMPRIGLDGREIVNTLLVEAQAELQAAGTPHAPENERKDDDRDQ